MGFDPSVPVWPWFLAPRAISHGLSRPVMTGPQPLSGRPQTLLSDMGAWHIVLADIALTDSQDKVRLTRAIVLGTLALGLPVYMPFYDWWRSPRVRAGLSPFPDRVPFSDMSMFSDSTAFDGDVPALTVAVAAGQRARQIVVQTTSGPIPTAGEFLGLGDRGHLVTAIFPDQPSAGQTLLEIQPPLRAAVSAGDLVETVNPMCRVKIDPKQVESLVTISNRGLRGTITLDFYEDNWT